MSRRSKPEPGVARQEPPEPAETLADRMSSHDVWCPDPERCPDSAVTKRRNWENRVDPRSVLRETPAEETARNVAYMAVHYPNLRDEYALNPSAQHIRCTHRATTAREGPT